MKWLVAFVAISLAAANVACAQDRERVTLTVSDKSPASCNRTASYTIRIAPDKFSIRMGDGSTETTSINPDGSFSKDFRFAGGALMNLVGNVKSREIQVSQVRSGCVWHGNLP